MKALALHPECDGKGCTGCNNGFVEVTLPEHSIYTLKCNVCGLENGGRITGPDLPPIPDVPTIGCVSCGASSEKCEYVRK